MDLEKIKKSMNYKLNHRKGWLEGKCNSYNSILEYSKVIIYLIPFISVIFAIYFFINGSFTNDTSFFVDYFFIPFFFIWLIFFILLKIYGKFGISIFYFENDCGLIGGDISGKVEVNKSLNSSEDVFISLEYINLKHELGVVNGGGSYRSEVISRLESRIKLNSSNIFKTKTIIPIYFKIPSNALPVDENDWQNAFFWELKIYTKLKGTNFTAKFEVPIFNNS